AQTWELTGVPGPSGAYSTFGQGCGGLSAYLPNLKPEVLLGGAPSIGGVVTMRLDGLPSLQPSFGFLGASNTGWGSIPLPLDLAILTMLGCKLFVSPDAAIPIPASSSTGT